MGAAVGAKFGSQNKGYETYGFYTEDTDCVFVVNTEAVTPGATSFTIRTTGTCTYIVNWGDDSSETVTATTATHNYSTAGTYNVGIDVISGNFRPYYNNNSDGDIITKFRGKSGYGFTGSLNSAFYGCGNLDEITADFSQVTSITNAFRDTPLVDFQNVGVGVTILKQNLSGFNDLTGITGFSNSFYNCPSLKTLAGLDFSSTTSFSSMFGGTTNLVKFGTEDLPIILGTTAGDLSLANLFYNVSGLRDFHVDTAQRVTSFSQTFYGSGSGLVNFGSETTPVGIGSTADNSTLVTFTQAFYQNSSLREFHLDYGDRISSLSNAFYASGITTFRIGDNKLTNVTNMGTPFYNSGLLSFGTEANPITFGSTGTDLSLSQTFQNTSSLTDFFVTDSNRISNFNSTFYGSGIVNFGSETTPVGIGSTADNSTLVTFSQAFYQDSSFKEFHLDYGDRISSLNSTFYSSGITTFRIGDNDLSNCTNMASVFYSSSIQEFGTETTPITFGSSGADLSLSESFRNTSSLTDFFVTDSNRISNFNSTFYGSGIVNFGSETTPVGIGSTADNSTLVTFTQAFYQNSSLREFHLDYGDRISSLSNAFYNAGITTFRIGDNKLTNITSMASAFRGTGLLSFGTEANPITFGSSGADLSLSETFRYTSSLTDFFVTDSNRISSFSQTFDSSGIVNFGSETTPVGIGSTADNSTLVTFSQAFNGVSSLREFHMDYGERISSLYQTFYNAGITTFRIGDNKLTNVTSMSNAFRGTGLLSFGTEANPITFGSTAGDLSLANSFRDNTSLTDLFITDSARINSFQDTFTSSGIVNFGSETTPIGIGSTADNSTLCTFYQSFQNVSAIREVHLSSGDRISSLQNAFYNSGITTFRIADNKLTNVTNMTNAFRGTGLLSFGTEANPISFGSTADNATTFTMYQAFYQNSSLKEVHLDSGERISSLQNTFYTNSGITTFRIGDNKLTNVTNMTNAFRQCGLLSFGTEANPITFGSTGTNVSLSESFYQSSSLTDFFITDSARITSFNGAIRGSGVVNFGTETSPIGIGSTADNSTLCTFQNISYQTSAIREVHLSSGDRISSLNGAYRQSGITTFRIVDGKLNNVTTMTNAFNQCASIRNFGTEANPIEFRTSGSTFSLSGAFTQAYALKEFHITSGAMINSLSSTFNEATGITTFKIGDGKLTNVTNMSGAFRRCYALLSFGSEANPISFGSTGTNVSLYESFYEATALTDFFVVDSARISSLQNAVRSTRIVNFGTETTPIGIGSTADNPTLVSCAGMFSQSSYIREFHMDYGERISSLSGAFYEAGITTFRVGDNKLTNCTAISFNRSSLRSFGSEANPISFGSTGTNLGLTESFRDNSSLTDFFITDSARITTFDRTFASTGLVNFGSSTTPIGLGSTANNSTLCDFSSACSGVSALREVHIDSGERISNMTSAFSNSGITTFRVNDTNMNNFTNGTNTFLNCALDADSIENILVSLDNGGISSGTVNMNGGSSAAKTTWTSAANTAYTNLIGKSWTITYNA